MTLPGRYVTEPFFPLEWSESDDSIAFYPTTIVFKLMICLVLYIPFLVFAAKILTQYCCTSTKRFGLFCIFMSSVL